MCSFGRELSVVELDDLAFMRSFICLGLARSLAQLLSWGQFIFVRPHPYTVVAVLLA